MTDLETQLRSLAVDRPEPAGGGEIRRRAPRRHRRRRGYVLGGIDLGVVALAFGLWRHRRNRRRARRPRRCGRRHHLGRVADGHVGARRAASCAGGGGLDLDELVDTPGSGAVVLAWAPGDEDRLATLVATAAERTRLDDGSWLLDGRRLTPGAGIYTVRSGHIVAILAVGIDDERLVDLAASVDSSALSEFEEAVARDGRGASEPPFDLQAVLESFTAPEPVTLRADVAGTGIEAAASDARFGGGLDLQLSIGNPGSSFTVPDPERRLVLTESERIDGTLLTAVAGICAPGLEGIEGTDPLTGETFEAPIMATEPLGDGRVLFLAVVEDRPRIPEAVTLDDDLGPTTFISPV